MEQAFHTTHIDNDDDQILIASWNPTRNPPYHCYRLVVAEYVKTRKADLINNEIRDSCNKSVYSSHPFIHVSFDTTVLALCNVPRSVPENVRIGEMGKHLAHGEWDCAVHPVRGGEHWKRAVLAFEACLGK